MGIYASILNNNYTFANSQVRKQQSVALLELPPEVLLAGLDSEGPPTVAAAEPPRPCGQRRPRSAWSQP